MKKLEFKVGLFAVVALLIIAYATVRVSERGVIKGKGYKIGVIIDSAEGLTRKTPVEVAGIQVGYVTDLELVESKRARATLQIDRDVKLGRGTIATVRTKGFLGETYIDLTPAGEGEIPDGGDIVATNPYVDLGKLTSDAEVFIEKLRELTENNEENINQMLQSLAEFSVNLRDLMEERRESLSETMERLQNTSRKIDEGRGTIGRLVNDEEIAENLNEAARGVSETIGGVNRFQFELGYHLEYLAETKDIKNYVGIALKPRPDKYFILQFIADPNPSPEETETTTVATTGGVTTTTVTQESIVRHDDFLISAQLAKSLYDFTFRGGVIESRGGVGLDWRRGPLGIEFSAFDFRSSNNQRPHLKAMASLYLTRNIFLVSGADDFISNQQDTDWFFGAGLNLIDEDIKSLFGAMTLGAASGR